MKKIFFLLFILILNFNFIFGITENDLSYVNKDLGIGIVIPTNWSIYTNYDSAPDYYKSQLQNKKSDNDNPVFLGIDKTQNNGIRLIVENYDASLPDYVELLKSISEMQNIKIEKTNYFSNNTVCVATYEAKSGKLTFKFLEYLIMNNNKVYRLTLWTLINLYNKYVPTYLDIIKNIYFYENNNWVSKWNDSDNIQSVVLENSNKSDKTIVNNSQNSNNLPYLFYSIKGKNNIVYILGSIHVGSDSFFPLSNNIENTFNKTPNLVVEVNVTKKEAPEDIRKSALLENNKTLDKVISKSLYKNTEETLKNFGVDIHNLKQYKPWLVAATLTVLKCISLGYAPDFGVDKYFLEKSKDKKIFELESIDFQTNLFNNMNGEIFLAYTLLGLKESDKQIEDMITAWKNGDEIKLNSMLFDQSLKGKISNLDKEIYENLYFKRNKQMFEKIKGYLNDNQDYFIVVGSGHLVGDKSIIKLLKDSGFIVTKN